MVLQVLGAVAVTEMSHMKQVFWCVAIEGVCSYCAGNLVLLGSMVIQHCSMLNKTVIAARL